jgi:hypothetical protein
MSFDKIYWVQAFWVYRLDIHISLSLLYLGYTTSYISTCPTTYFNWGTIEKGKFRIRRSLNTFSRSVNIKRFYRQDCSRKINIGKNAQER